MSHASVVQHNLVEEDEANGGPGDAYTLQSVLLHFTQFSKDVCRGGRM